MYEWKPQSGIDIVASDIQRGRDHGIPPYNDWRRVCGLEPITSFSQLAAGDQYKELYK